ncbi:hypothetical protein J4460_03320 [Candidatus Woesearchaeota archaeon]|nr:MAG: hypothetical protein QS99_C0008G0035 [archaeon GW2011_AR4]MBS3129678.1 hypothetical protein [Candidatus Woesearchaeota archaeon]HIH38782.1 hypothetical protein [Candidatus Woesearchaeota archaeon]HIH49198.1 hypothetical protein [Candidatus Woesearchaeota archaeon]HIJ03340.1 hypothetical protein [Candidatus Woesearchaeota archaeon]
MKGYSSLNQFIEDHYLRRVAAKIDPGKEGRTITKLLEKRIKDRLENATPSFRSMLKKNCYTLNDLNLIATHDTISGIVTLEMFLKETYGDYQRNNIRKLLKSRAFRTGKLSRLHDFIPQEITSKNDLLQFIRARKTLPRSEIAEIMRLVGKGDWKGWLEELLAQKKISERYGRVYA